MTAANRGGQLLAGSGSNRGRLAYLVVYLCREGFADDRWLDWGNDPELRVQPMTWGICRTDVRSYLRPGDDLWFVAYGKHRDPGDEHYLSARLRVGECIGWPDAVRRFGRRPNVLLDQLPRGTNVGEQVLTYIHRHRGALEWPEKRQLLEALIHDEDAIRRQANQFVVTLNGSTFVHSYWDSHENWKSRRLSAPYIVADASVSKILAEPIAYRELVAACPQLPNQLRFRGPYPHPKRRLDTAAAGYLEERCARAPAQLVPAAGVFPGGRCPV